jgi:hypothetical protein
MKLALKRRPQNLTVDGRSTKTQAHLSLIVTLRIRPAKLAELQRRIDTHIGAIQNANPSVLTREDSDLVERIKSGIRFTATLRSQGHMPAQITYITLPITSPPSQSLTLLRDAYHDGDISGKRLAELVYKSYTEERYALGVPPSYPARAFPSGIDPQWWVGLTKAEVRAGPLRESKADLRKAEAELREAKKRKGANKTLKKQDQYLQETINRKENGYRMWDDKDNKPVQLGSAERSPSPSPGPEWSEDEGKNESRT